MTDPARAPQPLSQRMKDVARLMARGLSYEQIATELTAAGTPIGVERVRKIVLAIAQRLPNPDGLPPQMLVALWAAHRLWLAQQQTGRLAS